MKGFARITLMGNLTRDPELRQLQSGTSICEMGVAVNESFKDAAGQWQDRPNYYDVKVWGPQGEACAKYLTKGSPVGVDGKLRQERWEAQDGTNRSKVVIMAQQVVFLGGGQQDGNGQQRQQTLADRVANPTPDDFRDIDFGGDDIPF